MEAQGSPTGVAGPISVAGLKPVTFTLKVASGHTYLVEVAEWGNDARVEILSSKQSAIQSSDHPERRSGTRRLLVTVDSPILSIRVTGKEHSHALGRVWARAFDFSALRGRPDCQAVFESLAAADSQYATAQRITLGLQKAPLEGVRAVFLRAAAGYEAADRQLSAPEDAQLRGQTELALASLLYVDLSDWKGTLDWSVRASTAFGRADPYRRARAEALTAAAQTEMGKPQAAASGSAAAADSGDVFERSRQEMRRLVRFHLARGERYDAGLQLMNLGLTYLFTGGYEDCIAAMRASGRLFDQLNDPPRRAQAWQNRALCLWGLGRMPEALHWFRLALHDLGPRPFPHAYLALLNNIALIDYALGHFDDSLQVFNEALALEGQIQATRDEGFSLYGIGEDYYALGDFERAGGFLQDSLDIRTPELDPRGRMVTLRALANVYAEQGHVEEALGLDDDALKLAVAPHAIQRIHLQLAAHKTAAGQPEDARKILDALLADRHTDSLIQAESYLQRGLLLRDLREFTAAQTDLESARISLHRLGSVHEEFAASLELARTRNEAGETLAAFAALDQALQLATAVRLQSANPELRSDLQAPLRAAYDLKIELLRRRYETAVSAGQETEREQLAAAAFLTADAARAHSLDDVARAEYPPAVRNEFAAELARREELYRELAARRFTLEDRIDRLGADDAPARRLMTDIAELERELDNINTRLAQRSQPVQTLATETVGAVPVLPKDTALVSYWLGSQSAYAWVLTRGSLVWTRLASPQTIGRQASDFHRSLRQLLGTSPKQRLAGAHSLAQLILGPLWPQLAGSRRWLVIPDGALDYVPFAALWGPDGFITLHHEVSLTPAAWRLGPPEVPPTAPRSRSLLLVADPVYEPDDPRLAGLKTPALPAPAPSPGIDPPRHYQRLAFAAREAHAVLAQFPPGEALQLIGLQATRERFLALDLSAYRYIHLATHGVVDVQVPELSALNFGAYDASGRAVDGAVRVADLALRRLTADVVVLSACDTALGKEVPSEGLVGLSSTALARGAHAVVASLWPVSDEMSAKLMTDFYRHLLRDSMSPAAALGVAMRSVLLRDGSADPALWAAYQVYTAALGPDLPPRAGEPSRLQARQGREEPP
jgi:CHAT domain-containing protein/tetratricopeptide (TPR) repeat protein